VYHVTGAPVVHVTQWFGNIVTMAWWDDLWLNEGFANTLMYFAVDSVYPSWTVVSEFTLRVICRLFTKYSISQ